MKYKLNRISLVPDKFGQYIAIKMITKYDKDGNYIKHIPLNETTVDLLKNCYLVEKDNN